MRKAAALLAGGNSRAEKAARAQLQRRDRYGRFAEMGGGFSFTIRGLGGSADKLSGRVVGASGTDDIEIEVVGDEVIPDGIYALPASKGETVKAILSLDAVEGLPENKALVDQSLAIDISEIKALAQPSDWTPREVADGEPREWQSADGLITRQFADGYVVYDSEGNEIGRGDSWVDIQKASADFRENGPQQPKPAKSTEPAEPVSAPKESSSRHSSIVERLEKETTWLSRAEPTDAEATINNNAGRYLKVLQDAFETLPELDEDSRKTLADVVEKRGVHTVRNDSMLISSLFDIPRSDVVVDDNILMYRGQDYGIPVRIERELAIASGDLDKVARIDAYVEFIKTASPEEYSKAVIGATNGYGQTMDRRIKVMMNNPMGLIEGKKYFTQHDVEERSGLQDAQGVARSDVRSIRRNVEAGFGIPNIEDNNAEDPYKDLRPASGVIQQGTLGKQRKSSLKSLYGDDVELMHDYTIGQPVDDSWTLDRANSYGQNSVILKPEVAERSLFTDTDSASGNPSAVLNSELLDTSANAVAFAEGRQEKLLWHDMVDSGNSMMSPAVGHGVIGYNEALVPGSFDIDEVEAMVISPGSVFRSDRAVGARLTKDGELVVGLYNPEGFETDARALVEASKLRRSLKEEHDVDLVVADLQPGSPFSVDKVEMFNPSMTEKYITEINPKAFADVSMDDLSPDATPMEALLRQVRVNIENGKLLTSFSPEMEKKLLDATPENAAQLLEEAKLETLNLIDAELESLLVRTPGGLEEPETPETPETPEPNVPDTPDVSPSTPDAPTSAVEKTLQRNKDLLARAPEFGRPSQEFLDSVNEDGRFIGTYGKVATTQEHATLRKELMRERIGALRERIKTDRDQFSPLEFDQRIFDTILEKSDEELIAIIEDTALKVAKGRIAGGRVWGHSSFLDSVLEEGYRPRNDTAGDIEGGHLLTLTGTRGAVETQTGIPLDSGLRATYGFSDYTFWEEERQRLAAARGAGDLYSSDYMITVNGKNGGGQLDNGFAGACDGYGDMEFILRPEVDQRSAVHFGDSLLHKGWGVGAADTTDEEAIESVIGHLENGNMNRNINSMLRTAITGDFVNWNKAGDGSGPGTYTETQTLGGFDANDIKAIRFDGMRVFPVYKDQFNPDGLDGAQEITDIAEKHLTIEKMREAGYTPTEIEYALNLIEKWKRENANGAGGRAQALGFVGFENLEKLVLARERKRVEARIKEKAPEVEVLFGSSAGINYENPESYGGNPGDSVEDLLGVRVLKDVLSQVQREIRWATETDDDDVEI
jgi:hypothetical protein